MVKAYIRLRNGPGGIYHRNQSEFVDLLLFIYFLVCLRHWSYLWRDL